MIKVLTKFREVIIVSMLLFTIAVGSNAQSTKSFLIGAGLDVVKSDIDQFADKAQIGVELNYFLTRNFSVSGGFEIWSQGDDSFAIGMRWYPIKNVFTRFRGLLGANDVSFGIGFSKPLRNNFSIEGIGDFYADPGDVAARIGITYIIR